jgi:hypothetical protein
MYHLPSDACLLNLMMDETHIVPKGSHFARPESHDGTHYNLTWRHRCTVAPVDYYYIDLGLSSWWPQGPEHAAILGISGQYKDVPELSRTVPYNPFKVDIYQLGRTILEVVKVSYGTQILLPLKTHISCNQKYPDLHMFCPLAHSMMCPNPNDRPTASATLEHLELIVSSMSRRSLRKRIWRAEDTFSERLSRLLFRSPML